MEGLRNRQVLIAAAAVGVLIYLGYRYLAGQAGTDEQRIWRAVDQMCEAVEQRSARQLVEHVDPEYKDASGMDRQELRRMLTGRFLQSKEALSCLVVRGELELAEGGAEATAHLWAAGFEGSFDLGGLAVPQNGDAFEITARFRKAEDGQWRVVWHERTRLSVEDVWDLATGQ
jgi:hypothetical protein